MSPGSARHDVAVVPGRTRDYEDAQPTTALLVVEVADSSVGQDRIAKAAIYARAAVAEYWIVSLREDRVERHREPDPRAGAYRTVTAAGHGERLAPVALPGVSVAVDDLLPGR